MVNGKWLVPSRNIFGCVTSLLLLVIDGAVATALLARRHTVQAYVEFLTILGVREFRMVDQHTPAVNLALSWALEAVLQLLPHDPTALHYASYYYIIMSLY